jgi:putative restriction endonuclease
MTGTVAITDHGWYEFLLSKSGIDEVNFWTPSAHFGFRGEPGAPFFFKLKAKYGNAICGFAHFAHFTRIPDYLAWELFGEKNGYPTFHAMQSKIFEIRKSIAYRSEGPVEQIGCILLVQPVFFAPDKFVRTPSDWPPANLRHKRYDLTSGEGARLWNECLTRLDSTPTVGSVLTTKPQATPRYGEAAIVRPRLGQGTFRASVLDAYGRACAATHEHSLPALEAAHIRPYEEEGPHDVRNGILLRADVHKLFDRGYLTVSEDYKIEVSPRLKQDFDNGKSYYPLHGSRIHLPTSSADSPAREFLVWHQENRYKAA